MRSTKKEAEVVRRVVGLNLGFTYFLKSSPAVQDQLYGSFGRRAKSKPLVVDTVFLCRHAPERAHKTGYVAGARAQCRLTARQRPLPLDQRILARFVSRENRVRLNKEQE